MPGHMGKGLLDGPGQIHKKRTRVDRSTLAQHRADPLVELMIRIRRVPFDEADEVRHVLRPVDERIGTRKILYIHVENVGRGMIETTGTFEAEHLGAAGEARDGNVVAEDIPDPPQMGRFRSDLELGFEHSLVMAL
jgi:hypothetical protein